MECGYWRGQACGVSSEGVMCAHTTTPRTCELLCALFTHVCKCVCQYVCMYVCMYVYIYNLYIYVQGSQPRSELITLSMSKWGVEWGVNGV